MSATRGFHDLLFEMSNENRYNILLLIREESKRITDLTRITELTTTEVRRHVSRLAELGLLRRDVEGF
jgi:predicted transcriptional regulator